MHEKRVFGYITFHNLTKVLFFFTTQENILCHFSGQIAKLLRREGCRSWTQALTDEQQEINLNNIHLLTVAKDHKSALRLKLLTAKLVPDCFIERTETFLVINVGRDEYLEKLAANNLLVSPAELAKMLKCVANAMNPLLNDEEDEEEVITITI